MKSVRRYAVCAAIPLLAACGNSPKTAQVIIPTESSTSAVSTSPPDKTSMPSTSGTHAVITSHVVPLLSPVGVSDSAHVASTATAQPTAASSSTSNTRPSPNLAKKTSRASSPASASAGHASATPRGTATATHTTPQAPAVVALSPQKTSAPSAITPGKAKAPAVVAPSANTKPVATQDATTFTAQVRPLPLFDSEATWPTGTKIRDGSWIVPITKVTETTITFYFAQQCGDVESCPTPDEKMTLPFASRNTPTTVVLGSNFLSATGALTAPAWAFAKMYNTGKENLDLSTMNFGPSYKIPASVPSKVYLSYFSSQDDGRYAEITVKNGAITALN